MSNRGSYELAQAVKNSGKMGTGGKIGIAFAVIVFIVGIGILIAYAVNPDIFKSKKEGDVCEGEDVRGTYEIDEDGKCALISCQAGWEVDGKTCVRSAPIDIPPSPPSSSAPATVYPDPLPGKTPTRIYPPTPFASVDTGDVKQYVTHVVSAAPYGNGEYRVSISNSAPDPKFDVDNLFDEGLGAPIIYDSMHKHAYHSTSTAVTWFHLYLPQPIYLDALEVYPRHFNTAETSAFAKHWQIWGIRDATTSDQKMLYDNTNVAVTFQSKINLDITDKTEKFSEFKVVFINTGSISSIIQEIAFMGHEDI